MPPLNEVLSAVLEILEEIGASEEDVEIIKTALGKVTDSN